MTLVREPGSEVIAQFMVPYKGTWKNTPAHKVPLDAIHDGLNIYIREGQLRSRPGLVQVSTGSFVTGDTNVVIGGTSFVNHDDVYIYLITKDRLFMKPSLAAWQVALGDTPIAISDNAVVDTTALQIAGEVTVLIASEGFNLKVKTSPGLTSALTSIASTILAKSVCIAASRVIALVPPHTITWSSTLNYNIFDPNSISIRAQTLDLGICVRTLSALSFVLYKDQSIHMARAQAGVDETTAFAFAEPIIVEGPAGIHAVVEAYGVHVYMTRSGRIAMFDGTNYPRWIADSLWFHLQTDINTSLAYKIRGVFDQRLNTVTFFYPKTGGTTHLQGMVTVCLLLETEIESGLNPPVFLGECQQEITHTIHKRDLNALNRALLVIKPTAALSDPFTISQFDETVQKDNTVEFTSFFQTGLQSAPDAMHIQPVVESFIERHKGYGTVRVEPIISDILENFSGDIPDVRRQRINLEFNPVTEYIGFNKKARFYGLKYTWASGDTVRYNGAVMYSKPPQRRQ